VARRIALPSADELFGEEKGATKPSRPKASTKKAAAKSSRATTSTRKRPAKASSGTAGSRRKSVTAGAAKPKTAPKPKAKATPKPRSKPAPRHKTPEQRLADIERRLSALPVDTLIDLRDGLEDLLSADSVDEAGVQRLLDTLQA
jgi:hypothetical protein